MRPASLLKTIGTLHNCLPSKEIFISRHLESPNLSSWILPKSAIKCYFSKKQFLGFNLSHALQILSHMLQTVVYWRSVQVIATLKISHLRNIWVSTHLCFLDDNVLCRSSISLTTSPGEAVSVNLHRKWQIRAFKTPRSLVLMGKGPLHHISQSHKGLDPSGCSSIPFQ